MELFEDEAAKLPLAVPSPPAGVSEFSVVRYLFCTICYVSVTTGECFVASLNMQAYRKSSRSTAKKSAEQ